MARPFPYAFIACPCADSPIPDSLDDDQTLDPRSPRSNFSLYPPEQLLYCEDCHQIKCPRCITEEIVCWYCPSCLFETPSSMVRSEGNRYTSAVQPSAIRANSLMLNFSIDAPAIASIVPFVLLPWPSRP